MSDVIKWSALAVVLTLLLLAGVGIMDDFAPFETIRHGFNDITSFVAQSSSTISNWRGVLNIFCNPYLLNFGLMIWLFYPLYKVSIILIKRVVNFFVR